MRPHDPDRWGSIARAFHWTIAAIIPIEVVAGWVMARTYWATDPAKAAWQFWTSNIHHSAGLTILLIVLIRLAWRLGHGVPDRVPARPPIERMLAVATHWLLYTLLIVIPLSGWSALSSLADSPHFGSTHLWLFGTDGFASGLVPRIATPVAWDAATPLRYGTFAALHRWLLVGGAVILTLHVTAALRHHFILRNATLRRML